MGNKVRRRDAELLALKNKLCQWNDTGKRCRMRAHVRVNILFNDGSQVKMLRCWEHYADIENLGRLSKTFQVTNAEVIPG